MPQPASDLTLLATAASELGVSAADAALPLRVSAASDAIRSYLNRSIMHYATGIVENVAGLNRQRLIVSRCPLVSIATIYVNNSLIDPSEYRIENSDYGVIYRRYGFPFTGLKRNDIVQEDNWPGTEEILIAVTYTGGWITPVQDNGSSLIRNLPYDLEFACLEAVSHLYRRMGDDRNVKSESMGDASVTYFDATSVLAPSTRATLDNYRRVAFA